MMQKAANLKHFISQLFDTYQNRLKVLNKKNYKIGIVSKEINEGDIITIISLLKDLYYLDQKIFYDFCAKENTELEDLIFDHGKINGLDEIYTTIKAEKQRIIIKQEKYRKIEMFYKIKRMKAKLKYEEELRKINEQYKLSQLNYTQNKIIMQKNMPYSDSDSDSDSNSDSNSYSSDSSDSDGYNNVIIDNQSQNKEQWILLDLEKIEI